MKRIASMLVAALIALSGCGGGSGATTPPEPPVIATAVRKAPAQALSTPRPTDHGSPNPPMSTHPASRKTRPRPEASGPSVKKTSATHTVAHRPSPKAPTKRQAGPRHLRSLRQSCVETDVIEYGCGVAEMNLPRR